MKYSIYPCCPQVEEDGIAVVVLYEVSIPVVPRLTRMVLLLWLAVVVGGGGEAKVALGRRYQSPFRKQQQSTTINNPYNRSSSSK